MKHATVERDGFTVPLIGIPLSATLDTCDLCGDVFSIRVLELSESGQLLCERCKAGSGARSLQQRAGTLRPVV